MDLGKIYVDAFEGWQPDEGDHPDTHSFHRSLEGFLALLKQYDPSFSGNWNDLSSGLKTIIHHAISWHGRIDLDYLPSLLKWMVHEFQKFDCEFQSRPFNDKSISPYPPNDRQIWNEVALRYKKMYPSRRTSGKNFELFLEANRSAIEADLIHEYLEKLATYNKHRDGMKALYEETMKGLEATHNEHRHLYRFAKWVLEHLEN